MTSADPTDERLLARFYKARDAVGLALHGPGGLVHTHAILIRDYRREGGAEAIELEVNLAGPLNR